MPFSARALAGKLGITERSADRIVRRLEENGYVTIVGKVSDGKGRPDRLMKADGFPQLIHNS